MNVSDVMMNLIDISHIVNVLINGIILVLCTVLLVPHNVQDVLIIMKTVQNVELIEYNKSLLVLAQLEQLTLKDNVSLVSTDVLNVVKLPLIVLHVLKDVSMPQNVSALMDSMMMDITPNVNNVTQDVKDVEIMTFVMNVKIGDLLNHTYVHVPLVTMIVLQKDLVVNVTTDVQNVTPTLETVGLVLPEELTTHQSVLAHTDIPKLIKFVNIVTKKDVKLVTVMFYHVLFVKLIENQIHQNVHVQMVYMNQTI